MLGLLLTTSKNIPTLKDLKDLLGITEISAAGSFVQGIGRQKMTGSFQWITYDLLGFS